MLLAATALESSWDGGKELLFLGPWCLRHERREIWSRREHKLCENPWRTLDSRAQAYHEANVAYEKALAYLAEALNALHGSSHGLRYWRILLGPWLMRYAQVLRDRVGCLRAAADAHPGLSTKILPRENRVAPRDALDFILAVYGDEYNFQLYSQCWEALGLPGEPFRLSIPADYTPREQRLEQEGGWRRLALALSETVRKIRAFPVLCHELGVSARGQAALLAKLKGKAWMLRPSLPAFSPPRLDHEKRRRLSALPADNEYERVFARTLGENLPWLYLEAYPALSAWARENAGPAARAIYSVNGWTFCEGFKAIAAEQSERGARLIAAQHGGGYGVYARIWQEQLERASSDSFWTWGWAGLEKDPKLRDQPSATLGAPLRPRAGGDWLLLTSDQPRYRYGFQSQAQAGEFLDYLERREEFLSRLAPELLARLVVRLPRADLGWGQRERLARLFPSLRIEDASEPLKKRLARASLAIIDQPSTTLLDAFAADLPLVLFWDAAVWDLRPSVRPLFDALRKTGTLHANPADAAAHLRAISSDPLSWWNQAALKSARAEFRATQALSAADWPDRWAEALNEELATG